MSCPGRGEGFHPAATCSWGGEWLASAVLPYPRGALSPVLPINHLQ